MTEDLIWGVSGFAEGGHDYTAEAHFLNVFYKYLVATDRKPCLSVDGGVSEGNLGLNAIAAAMHQIQTLGCIPLEGLASISARTFMIAWGNVYRDREILVGTIPDAILCMDGADATRRECQIALANEGVVFLMRLKDYGPKSLGATYQNDPEMMKAITEKRLFVCRSMSELRAALDANWEKIRRTVLVSRELRFPIIKHLLEG